MSLKKHPILRAVTILGIIALFLGAAMTSMPFFPDPSSIFPFSSKIGVIPVSGTVKDPSPIISQIVEFRKNKRIRAIIVRIDSPGGGVGASQEIYREIKRTAPEKKVIASLGGIAASGGYYIASACDKIVANPGTITGSIGVIMEIFQIHELSRNIGISLEVIKGGEYKDVGSPHREITKEDKNLLEALILEIQEQFITAVAGGRNLPPEKVRDIADGRIMSGATARDLGLIDNLGNFQDAVDLAKEMTGLEGDVELVYPKKSNFRLLEYLVRNIAGEFSKMLLDDLKPHLKYSWGAV
ncbi:MAG: signal peptide peptidase SppA [Deltaproteobacteria bacterium]|nr:signal peptide peptidase SppA [Deltaproteobacteria bacterium]